MGTKQALQSVIKKNLAPIKTQIRDIETALVETVVEISKKPNPKDGKDGQKGLPGSPGENGRPGKSGHAGKRGVAGIKGERGIQGFSGRDGKDGKDGKRGLKGDKGEAGRDGVNHHTFNNVGNSTLHAGEIGRLSSATSILDSDDFAILRSGQLLRVTAETLAAYIVAENTTTKEITFADSPYPVTVLDDFINVDSSGGNVVINLLPLSTVPIKPIYIRQNDGEPNTTTITPNGSDTINDIATLVISSDENAEMVVPFAASWRSF